MQKRLVLTILLVLAACGPSSTAGRTPTSALVVPKQERWGIYRLDIDSQQLELVYSSPTRLSYLRLNNAGNRFVFSQRADGDTNNREEIFALNADGQSLQRLTDNDYWDLYPAWSPMMS